ncbi:MAG: NAD(P)H-dependent oxidoreductase [Terrimonas sp.]|nr:NAD(P)H-dependent oxidoreductase [Terrimonas sp.]OJY94033.1 MAG: NADPH:quinone reductase [Sphingobacteriales bacterium 40-81]
MIFDHPYGIQASENKPHQRSFSAAVYKRVKETIESRGGVVDLIDLRADKFNPVMSKEDLIAWRTGPFVDKQTDDYFQRLLVADRIIFIFPIWWESMPASTKGFLDKVLAKGRLKSGDLEKLKKNNPAIYVMTVSGTPTIIYRFWYGNPIVRIMKRGTFSKIGLNKFRWINFNAEEQRLGWAN